MRAVAPGELYREVTDASGRSQDQHPLIGAETPSDEETLPRGERAHRDRGALDVIDRLRLGREDVRGNRSVLRGDAVAVERRQREDLIAGSELRDIRANGLDHARKLIRRDRGQSIDGPVKLVARDRGRPDPDQRLTGGGDGPVDLLDHDARRAASVEESHRSHGPELTESRLSMIRNNDRSGPRSGPDLSIYGVEARRIIVRSPSSLARSDTHRCRDRRSPCRVAG